MSKFYLKLSKKDHWLGTVIAVIVLLWLSAGTQAQGLEFKNGRRISGNDGEDGAVYKFASVTKDVDGYIKINGRFSSGVKLTDIDLDNTGWDKAFQPQIEYKNKSAYGNDKDWWMEFEISFKDDLKNIANGLVYYRLKMVDLDGNYSLSDVRIIKLTEDNASQNITVYPNPVVSDLRITLASGWQDKAVHIQVLNANGQSVVQFDRPRVSQTESVNLNNLKPGLYVIHVSNGTGSALQRFIKAK